MSGKNKFYPKVKKSFIEAGYDYYDGDEDIKGKTRQHRRKPDYIAVKRVKWGRCFVVALFCAVYSTFRVQMVKKCFAQNE